MDVIKNRTTEEDSGGDQAPTRLPAGMVEDAIVTEVRRILQTPEVVTQMLAALKRDQVSEAEAIAALHDFNTLWVQLFPREQARIIQILVRRVTVTAVGLEVDIRREGVAGMRRLGGRSRRQIFEEEERSRLRALPHRPFRNLQHIRSVHVPEDYHVEHRGNFYSVPHELIGKTVDLFEDRSPALPASWGALRQGIGGRFWTGDEPKKSI